MGQEPGPGRALAHCSWGVSLGSTWMWGGGSQAPLNHLCACCKVHQHLPPTHPSLPAFLSRCPQNPLAKEELVFSMAGRARGPSRSLAPTRSGHPAALPGPGVVLSWSSPGGIPTGTAPATAPRPHPRAWGAPENAQRGSSELLPAWRGALGFGVGCFVFWFLCLEDVWGPAGVQPEVPFARGSACALQQVGTWGMALCPSLLSASWQEEHPLNPRGNPQSRALALRKPLGSQAEGPGCTEMGAMAGGGQERGWSRLGVWWQAGARWANAPSHRLNIHRY